MARFPLVDTNVFLRHLRDDHPEFSRRAVFFERIAAGELVVEMSEPVVCETEYTVQRLYRQSRAAIRDSLLPLLDLPGIRLPTKPRLRRTFAIYVTYNLSFADAYQAALVLERGHPAIVSFDRDYDGIPGVSWVEP
jgi:predicted nucleic acid-binding protein